MTRAQRTGVLGGTFDPIHVGHLAAAAAAARALALDEVIFIPSHQPPHRSAPPQASAFHRFAMVVLATAEDERFVASDVELRTPGPSFTALTLRALHAAGLPASQLFFVTGTDAFAEIATWHDYPAVLDLAHFAVISRPGQSFDELRARLPRLAGRMCEVNADPPHGDRTSGSPCIFLVRADTPDVSSTEIRAHAAAARPLAGMVPPAVDRHIGRHRLYARTTGSEPPARGSERHTRGSDLA
jgi:nicotinate-nucleotide adenylyltransferase